MHTQHFRLLSKPKLAQNDVDVDPIVKLNFVIAVLQAADGMMERKAATD